MARTLSWLTRQGWVPGHTLMVTLDSSRREAALASCASIGLTPELFDAQRQADGALGCLDSHLQMITLARDRQWPCVLLLEDDVQWTDGAWSDLPADWHLCYMGAHINDGQPDRPGLLRVRSTLTTHAYLVHARAYDAILQQSWTDHIPEWTLLRHDRVDQLQEPLSRSAWSAIPFKHQGWLAPRIDWSKRAIDVFLAHYIQDKPCFCVWPFAALQAPGLSTIEQRVVDYNALFQWKGHIAARGGARLPLALLIVATRPGPIAFQTYADRLPRLVPHCRHHGVAWLSGEPTILMGGIWGMPLHHVQQQIGRVDTLLVTDAASDWTRVDASEVRQLVLIPTWWDVPHQKQSPWRDAITYTEALPLLPRGAIDSMTVAPGSSVILHGPDWLEQALIRPITLTPDVPPAWRPLGVTEQLHPSVCMQLRHRFFQKHAGADSPSFSP